jgi:flagellar biosynthesis chaperone FliJ
MDIDHFLKTLDETRKSYQDKIDKLQKEIDLLKRENSSIKTKARELEIKLESKNCDECYNSKKRKHFYSVHCQCATCKDIRCDAENFP